MGGAGGGLTSEPGTTYHSPPPTLRKDTPAATTPKLAVKLHRADRSLGLQDVYSLSFPQLRRFVYGFFSAFVFQAVQFARVSVSRYQNFVRKTAKLLRFQLSPKFKSALASPAAAETRWEATRTKTLISA